MPFSDLNRPGQVDGWKATFQGHHLIPEQVYGEAEFDFLKHLSEFNIDDFDTNGIYLPSNIHDAVDSGLPLHNTNHPEYSEYVRIVLREIKENRIGDIPVDLSEGSAYRSALSVRPEILRVA